MRYLVIGSVVLLAMAAIARCEEPKQSPKEFAVDLGGGVKLEMVLIPAGNFMMGSPDSDKDASAFGDEKPQHRVRITKPFYLGKYEVTQEQWEAVMGNNPSHFKGPKNPVESVSWDDCQQFLAKLNAKSRPGEGKAQLPTEAEQKFVAKLKVTPRPGDMFQLPTEAQWEYACRAGSATKYCFGDDKARLGDYAWYGANSGGKTHPVGEKKSNAFGLYDMHGNVWEWCADWYWGYAKSPANDPRGPNPTAMGNPRRHAVRRGGSWYDGAGGCRSADRGSRTPGLSDSHLGFRIARVAADK